MPPLAILGYQAVTAGLDPYRRQPPSGLPYLSRRQGDNRWPTSTRPTVVAEARPLRFSSLATRRWQRHDTQHRNGFLGRSDPLNLPRMRACVHAEGRRLERSAASLEAASGQFGRCLCILPARRQHVAGMTLIESRTENRLSVEHRGWIRAWRRVQSLPKRWALWSTDPSRERSHKRGSPYQYPSKPAVTPK